MQLFKRNTLKSFEIAVGSGVFDLRSELLLDSSGAEIALRYRSRQVLKYLVKHRGRTVDRIELVQAVWDIENVSDDSVAQCIADIRRALADKDKRLVETIPRRGYRLAAPEAENEEGMAVVDRTASDQAWVPQHTQSLHKTTIAILPFEDHGITGVQSTALRAALAEAIITDLARNPELAVISRAASFQFSATQPVSGMFARMQADFVLAGALFCDGECGRVSLQLVSAEDHTCAWVDTFDFTIEEMLGLAQSIGRHVANVVGATVIDMAETRLSRGDLSAILIENAARSRMLRYRSKDAWRQNIVEQDFSLEQFPDSEWGNFGQALAICVGIDAGWQTDNIDAASGRAQSLIARALEIAPKNYLSYYALGRMHAGNGDMKRAIAAYERAAKLNPSSTLVLSGLIVPYLYLGNTSRAHDIIAQAEQIDPFHTDDLVYKKALTFWQSGESENARDTLLTSPDVTVEDRKLLAVVHMDLGDKQAACDALAPFLSANSSWTLDLENKNQSAKWSSEITRQRWISHLETAGLSH